MEVHSTSPPQVFSFSRRPMGALLLLLLPGQWPHLTIYERGGARRCAPTCNRTPHSVDFPHFWFYTNIAIGLVGSRESQDVRRNFRM